MNRTTLAPLTMLLLLVGCGGGGGSNDPDVAQVQADDPNPFEPAPETPTTESTAPSESDASMAPSTGGNVDDPNLPSGLPAGTPDLAPPTRPEGPTLQPVSSSSPESEQPSIGGLDSTQTEFERLRTTPSAGNDNGCHNLMAGMLIDRGLPEESEDQPDMDGFNRQAWWYYTQGYMAAFGWNGSDVCEALDFRFAPTLQPDTPQNDADDLGTTADPVAEQSPAEQQSSDSVDIVLVDLFTQSFGALGVRMRVTNNLQSSRIYNVSCNVQALDASSTIVDGAFVYFGSGGTIDIGESAEANGTFFSLNSFDDFETTRWKCDWLIR